MIGKKLVALIIQSTMVLSLMTVAAPHALEDSTGHNIIVTPRPTELVSLASSANSQLADFGDAPDPTYPTLRSTTSTPYSNRTGPYHLNVTQEWIGRSPKSTTTVEPDALVVDLDFDDGDRGLIRLERVIVDGSATNTVYVSVPVTISENADSCVRYLNVVVDINSDGRWGTYATGEGIQSEWVVDNLAIYTDPGYSTNITTSFALMDPSAAIPYETWLRATLTTEYIDPAIFDPNCWDGSGPIGGFLRGETEDWIVRWQNLTRTIHGPVPPEVPPPPSPPAVQPRRLPEEGLEKEGIDDFAQEENECAPTSAADSLYYLARANGFIDKLPPISPDGKPRDLIDELKRRMVPSWDQSQTFPGAFPKQFYNGKEEIARERGLPIKNDYMSWYDMEKKEIPTIKFIVDALERCDAVEIFVMFCHRRTNKVTNEVTDEVWGCHVVTVVGYGLYEDGSWELKIHDPADGHDGDFICQVRIGQFIYLEGPLRRYHGEKYPNIEEDNYCAVASAFTQSYVRPPIKIGVIGPEGSAFWSPCGMKDGAEIARDEINAFGGINVGGVVRPIELVVGDEHSWPYPDPLAAVSEVEDLIAYRGCTSIIGGYDSACTAAMIDMAMNYQIPFLVVGASPDTLISETVAFNYDRYKYLFRISPFNMTTQISTMANFLQQIISTKLLPLYGTELMPGKKQIKVAVLTEDSFHYTTMHNTLTDPAVYPALLGPFANVTYQGRIPSGADCTPWLQDVNDSGARLLIHGFSDGTGMVLIAQCRAMNVSVLPVGINEFSQLQITWAITEGACEYETIITSVGTRTPIISGKTEVFWDEFVEKTGFWPTYAAFGSYDAIYTLKEAIEAAGTLEPDVLISHLETTERMSLSGLFKFTGDHDAYCDSIGPNWTEDTARPLVVQWQAGRMEVVCPSDQSYAKKWAIPSWMYPLDTDVNYDGKVNIMDIAAAAKAFATKPGDIGWDKEADVNFDGQINILDIAKMAIDFGKSVTLPLP